MKLFVLSDLHLTGPEDPFYSKTLGWIQTYVKSADILVLAGDIFDLYVGKKAYFRKRFHEFHQLMEQLLERGVKIHYIEGNHDFRLRGVFPRSVEIHEAEVTVSFERYSAFIAHGDLVDPSDHGYRALRAFFRSPPFSLFIDRAPDGWIKKIGETLSHKSQLQQGRRRSNSEDEAARQERTRKIYRSYAAERIATGAQFVVLGHCHLLDEFKFQVEGRAGHYMNMGYPKTHESGIVIDSSTGEMSRLRI